MRTDIHCVRGLQYSSAFQKFVASCPSSWNFNFEKRSIAIFVNVYQIAHGDCMISNFTTYQPVLWQKVQQVKVKKCKISFLLMGRFSFGYLNETELNCLLTCLKKIFAKCTARKKKLTTSVHCVIETNQRGNNISTYPNHEKLF